MSDESCPRCEQRDGPQHLEGAQRRIRDEYFENEAGLFTLDCVPGAGKSFTVSHIVTEELLRRFVDGDKTPEQRLCVVSFTRDDASRFVPSVISRLRDLVEYDMTPAASGVSDGDVAYLADRIRRAPHFGTIDSVLREVLSEVVADVGFDEMPAVGADGRLNQVHDDCYTELTADSAYSDAVDVVTSAYPTGEYDAGPAELLRQAQEHCRVRRLTPEEFTAELRSTLDAVYQEGETTTFDDIADALARCVGPEAANEACGSLAQADREDIVEADQHLRTAWVEAIESFGTLLDGYYDKYARLIRERGIISHTDCAFLVAEFLAGNIGSGDAVTSKRERVLARYRNRIETVIIDEAQDLSELQHAALAHLVTEECRVLAAGDVRQTVYVWRDARPSIFERAVEDGRYLGLDWDTHLTETAAATYRCRPDIATAINSIAEPALTDATRGNLGDLDLTYPALDAAREDTEGPSVHIAAFITDAPPGTQVYVSPDRGKGEAEILATYIARGLADGTLVSANDSGDEPPNDADVTVLFRWRTHMERYEQAFEAEGLTVANRSQHLFHCPAVTATLDAAEWVLDPLDADRLRDLVTESELGLSGLEGVFAAHGWDLDAVLDGATDEITADQRDVLSRLQRLRESRGSLRARSAALSISEVIETLALRADPNGIATSVNPAQRVANLDMLARLVSRWTTEPSDGLREALEMLDSFRAEPRTGPTQPPIHRDDPDVVFRTVHQAKGSESDVVALADLGWDLYKHGPVDRRLVTTGGVAALAPPTAAAAPEVDSLSVFARGLYDPDRGPGHFGSATSPRDVGLRWASEHWTDEVDPADHAIPELAGHDRLQTATRLARAEAQRLLFVALSRPREHLVVPLPRDTPGADQPRDRWLETVRDGLRFDGTPGSGTYSLDVEGPDGTTESIDVAVNDVNATTEPATEEHEPPARFAAERPIERAALRPLVPRILRPSTLYPLTEASEENLLDHLQGRALHTATDSVDGDLPLSLDAFDADDVGRCAHSVLARCVKEGVSQRDLRTSTERVERIIEDELTRHGPPATNAERNGLRRFLTELVLPDFATSKLWDQLQAAENVYVEKRLRGHIRRDGVEFELEGQADFVIENPDESWSIIDTKTALTDMNTETRHRYELQTACYAALLAQLDDVDGPVSCSVETFGVVTERIVTRLPQSAVTQRLDELLDGGK
jgi:ATP-dependent helicase/nuclease subunit A